MVEAHHSFQLPHPDSFGSLWSAAHSGKKFWRRVSRALRSVYLKGAGGSFSSASRQPVRCQQLEAPREMGSQGNQAIFHEGVGEKQMSLAEESVVQPQSSRAKFHPSNVNVVDTRRNASMRFRDEQKHESAMEPREGRKQRELQLDTDCPLKQQHDSVNELAFKDSRANQTCKGLRDLHALVFQLELGGVDKQLKAATDIQLVTVNDAMARVTLSMLGAIPPLISMLESSEERLQISAISALLSLADGNALNKYVMVKAGVIPGFVKLLKGHNVKVQEMVVSAFLSLSAIEAHRILIRLCGALPFILEILLVASPQGKMDALAALLNMSVGTEYVEDIVKSGYVPSLLRMAEDMTMADKILAILSNIVGVDKGRKAIAGSDEFPHCIITILEWVEKPSCQELASYLLLVIAHYSRPHGQAMVQAGAVPVLVELALLGTPLAQERALRILGILRQGRDGVSRAVSGPLTCSLIDSHEQAGDQMYTRALQDQRKMVKGMVKQSLQRNMKKIARRANVPAVDIPSTTRLRALTNSSSSKSLPF